MDLACGQNKQEGFYGIDICKCPVVDKVWDLEKRPWPLKANSVDEAHASHYIEHTRDFFGFLDELYRVLKVGAKATLIAPYMLSRRAWQDPTHTRAICEQSFLYGNKEWREVNKLSHYPVSCDYDFCFGYNMTPEWASKSHEAIQFALKHYWDVANDIVVTLTKRG